MAGSASEVSRSEVSRVRCREAPSREQRSWLQLATVGYSWLQLATVGYSWLQLATVGYSWLQLAIHMVRVGKACNLMYSLILLLIL